MKEIAVEILGKGNFRFIRPINVIVYKYRIDILEGFTTDFASMPKIAWSIVGCPTDYALPSAVHDALYRSRLLSRKEADYIFFMLLIEEGVSKPLARSMYLSVRAGGQKAYDEAIHMMAHYREYVIVTPI